VAIDANLEHGDARRSCARKLRYPVDAFAVVILGGLVAVGLWAWLAGRRGPGHGPDPLGLRSAREIIEDREALEAEDLAQLLEASNARRRAHGLPERTLEQAEREFRG
jgi:hypothetical protein